MLHLETNFRAKDNLDHGYLAKAARRFFVIILSTHRYVIIPYKIAYIMAIQGSVNVVIMLRQWNINNTIHCVIH